MKVTKIFQTRNIEAVSFIVPVKLNAVVISTASVNKTIKRNRDRQHSDRYWQDMKDKPR